MIAEKIKMKKAIIYVHGKGGSAEEAEHYRSLFPEHDVIGLDYKAQTPWEAKEEFSRFFDKLNCEYESITIIANSIGAFFTMCGLNSKKIDRAFFISPIVDMEKLICNMMTWTNVTEEELQDKKEIATSLGEVLSWEYLCYVRSHPLQWSVPTSILYGSKDNLTSYETILAFAQKHAAQLSVMEGGEHWFHTDEQLEFLDEWLANS